MLRVGLAAALIAVGGGIGITVSSRYGSRVRGLAACEAFLLQLITLLESQCLSTKEMLLRLNASGSFTALPFLRITVDALQSGTPFPAAWRDACEECRRHPMLAQCDYALLAEVGAILGAGEAAWQIENLALLRERIRQNLETACEERRTLGRLYRSLGFSGALAAAILLF